MLAFKPVKKSLITTTQVFVGMLVALIAVFLFSNIGSLFGALGFETKTSLKAKVVQAESNVQRLSEVNAANVLTIEKQAATAVLVQ
jgi:hypothetical protein